MFTQGKHHLLSHPALFDNNFDACLCQLPTLRLAQFEDDDSNDDNIRLSSLLIFTWRSSLNYFKWPQLLIIVTIITILWDHWSPKFGWIFRKTPNSLWPHPLEFFSPKIHQNLVLQSSPISLITTIITMIVCVASPKSGLICIYKYNTHRETMSEHGSNPRENPNWKQWTKYFEAATGEILKFLGWCIDPEVTTDRNQRQPK